MNGRRVLLAIPARSTLMTFPPALATAQTPKRGGIPGVSYFGSIATRSADDIDMMTSAQSG